MIIKKYTGQDLDKIRARIDAELGPSSVIMMTRLVHHGVLQQFFLDDEYEVTVGIDEDSVKSPEDIEMGAVSCTSLHGNIVRIPVTGPLCFDPNKQNIILLLGLSAPAKMVAIAKFALKLKQSFSYDTEIISINGDDWQSLECLARVFFLKHSLYENFTEACMEISGDLLTLIHVPFDQDLGKIVSLVPSRMHHHAYVVLNFSDGIEKNHQLLAKYHPHLNGMIVTGLEESPGLLPLLELTQAYRVPVAYLSDGAKFSLADADELEVSITNERLKHSRKID